MKEVVEKFYAALCHTQFLPPHDMQRYQRQILDGLLRHARVHVPFYRDSGRLDVLFRGDGTIDWERWGEVPPLTRSELQSSSELLKAESYPEHHGRLITQTTSGTTGEPIRVNSTHMAVHWTWAAVRLRNNAWHHIDTSKRMAYLYPYIPVMFDGSGRQRFPMWYVELLGIVPDGERINLSNLRSPAELVDELLDIRPQYLLALPTTVELIMAADVHRRLPDLHLDAISFRGEYLSPKMKRDFETYFNTRVLDVYGSTECGTMAGTCPHCGRMHVNSELSLVEALTEANIPAAPGETGRLLITPLYNYAMPLIRYEQGDDAIVGEPEQCDIALPALNEVIGKRRPAFVFPGGRSIRPTMPTQWVAELLGARMYQIAQVAEDRCEFRIVPGGFTPSPQQCTEMTERIRTIWWDGLQVDYRVVEDLPRRSERSKPEVFRQEMSTPQA